MINADETLVQLFRSYLLFRNFERPEKAAADSKTMNSRNLKYSRSGMHVNLLINLIALVSENGPAKSYVHSTIVPLDDKSSKCTQTLSSWRMLLAPTPCRK